MELVNKVRKHVFFLSFIKIGLLQQRKKQGKIIRDKESEYIQTQVIYCDYRRLNKDPSMPVLFHVPLKEKSIF